MTKEWTERSAEVAVECVHVRNVHVRQAEEGGHRDEGGNQEVFFLSHIKRTRDFLSWKYGKFIYARLLFSEQ